ncbi:hypothetical protein QWY85_00135 [Neolewinella lacunae]|uniref:Polyketide cyclase n=1 Tax=Neolewinella lacunae TaxID=1517758 RepID=A0A923PRD0_9BACT|nr:hypothetical protein [Neolewinella lacunae]MBC6995332.1 hypothetical protein [Neolewinella lacunae]MDN3633044.1 hypothetical protein [Neolewinella lacunae]
MRPLLLLFISLTALPLSAQDSLQFTPDTLVAASYPDSLPPAPDTLVLAARWDSLLTTPDWLESTPGPRNGYRLTLTTEGNFDEDGGPSHGRAYQHLLGRWTIDTAAHTLTFGVDGMMGNKLVHRRYLRGRDFFITYDVLTLNAETLRLRDRLTDEIRTFTAAERTDYVDPAVRRMPKFPDPVKLKLPGEWGGG